MEPGPNPLVIAGERLRAVTKGNSHFVGFHDVTPWNEATDEIVCLTTSLPEDRLPGPGEMATVMVIQPDGAEIGIATTRAWNWQKAARQRFVPSLGKRIVLFNDASEDGFCARLIDLELKNYEISRMPRAIYDISPDGTYGLSVDMIRLSAGQPGYGYAHDRAVREPDRYTGIIRVEIASGQTETIVSLSDFITANGTTFDLGLHFFTHIQISPDSARFAFIHRCYLANGGLVNNLVVANADGSNVRIIHDDKVSHFDWEGPDSIIAWCRQNAAVKALKESPLKAIARPLFMLSRRIRSNAVRQGFYNEAFRRIDLSTGRKTVIGRGVLVEDGHPQVHPAIPHLWVNDTYPTPKHIQTLMLFHAPSGRRIDLSSLPTQHSIQETLWRCDFHPRWKPTGDMVCVDSAHLGRRQVCVADVSDEIAELTGSPV